jgi:hypothetical protein
LLSKTLSSRLLVRSVKVESDRAVADRLWRVAHGAESRVTTYALAKRYFRYCLIYWINVYLLSYKVVEMYVCRGAES